MNGTSVVVFDLDGTLLDTPGAIVAVMQGVVAIECGIEVSGEKVRSLIGRPLSDLCAQLTELEVGSPGHVAVVDRYRIAAREQIAARAESLLYRGVVDGLAELVEQGIRVGVVTNKEHEGANAFLRGAKILDFFGCVVGCDDVTFPKPSPEPAMLALTQLGGDPRSSLFVGDTVVDIRTGKAVPMRTVAVTYGVDSYDELAQSTPDFLVSDFSDVVAIARNDTGGTNNACTTFSGTR